jgi:hypothetical protein
LPISTTLMLRAIAEIARQEARTSPTPRRRLPASRSRPLAAAPTPDNLAESGYFAVRSALAKVRSEAARS